MMDKLIDILIEWAQKHWSLLFLLATPLVFQFVQKYYGLSFHHTLKHGLFWIGSGVLFLLSGVIDLISFPQELYGIWLFPSGFLIFCGLICIMIGILQYGNEYFKKTHEFELEERQLNIKKKRIDILIYKEKAKKYGVPEYELEDIFKAGR